MKPELPDADPALFTSPLFGDVTPAPERPDFDLCVGQHHRPGCHHTVPNPAPEFQPSVYERVWTVARLWGLEDSIRGDMPRFVEEMVAAAAPVTDAGLRETLTATYDTTDGESWRLVPMSSEMSICDRCDTWLTQATIEEHARRVHGAAAPVTDAGLREWADDAEGRAREWLADTSMEGTRVWLERGPDHVRRLLAATPQPEIDVERLARAVHKAVGGKWANRMPPDEFAAAIAAEYAALSRQAEKETA